MPTDQIQPGHYFDTPARAERLQLLLHLVRNAGEVIYLRAPAGAGKTLFAQRLFDALDDQTATVWVRASQDCDVAAVAVDQLGLPPSEISPWPDAVMAGLGGQDLLVIVDDADRLGLEAVESLAVLHARGGRLLLVGQGGLAQMSGNWDVQFVDLPPFEPEQTVAFLRSMAGEQAARVTDDLAAGLHRASHGLPGPLLDALNGVLGSAEKKSSVRRPVASVPESPKQPGWYWLAGGALVLLLTAVLLFQDQINALFESEQARSDRPAVEVVEAVAPANTLQPSPDLDTAPAETLRPETPAIQVAGIAPPDPAAALDESATMPASVPVPGTSGDADDPLDAVKRDVLAAAETRDDPVPTASKPVTDKDDVSVKKVVADAAMPPEEADPPALPAAPESSGDADDPLDAVMRDALAAAETSDDPAPAASEPVTDKDEASVQEVLTDAAMPPQAAAPEVVSPVVEAMPEESVPAAAGPVQEPVPVESEPKVAAAEPAPVETRQAPAGAPVVRAEPTMVAPTPPATAPDAQVSSAKDSGQEEVAKAQEPQQTPPAAGAPVESRQAPAQAPVVRAQPAVVVSQPAPRRGSSWLENRAPSHYTLQLVGSRDRTAVQKFVRDHGIKEPHAIFARDLKGRPWYSLVAGDYPSRAAAIAARGRLPKGLDQSGIWPRTFESIQKLQ